MGKSLIIVESPAKIKTLKKFLGQHYLFESSVGHVRDLPEKGFGIDIEQDFTPQYEILKDKTNVISSLKKSAKKCDTIYLCPDPDREGEAIAWHIKEILKDYVPKTTHFKRVTFNSITKEAVVKALGHPGDINQALVDAQQARRLLDRIVGYKISPILNRRIHRGKGESVSAGRVQSVALKLVVDREKEIEAFVPVEYWKLTATLKTKKDDRTFKAYLYSVDGKKVAKEPDEKKESFIIGDKETADAILARLNKDPYEVLTVEKKEKRRFPVPPFITSTLQQEASRHYGFSSARTMAIAQKLYEGIDMGKEGAEGLITYMRTDSVRVAPEAISEVRNFIQKIYGEHYLPETPKYYSTKKSAQDAHEAIRPTNLQHPPDKIQSYLSREEFLLYQLIWQRFIASQMMPAIYDTLTADLTNQKAIVLRATGSIVKFPGFLAVYEEKEDEENKDEELRILPPLEAKTQALLLESFSEQSFTRPPPRYSEASLIKELEKSGIGRPSTYAAIMNKIQNRDYTVKENGRLKPTELGRVIAVLLENNFAQIMNVNFTAHMEDDLELVAENKMDWKKLLEGFWTQFSPVLDMAEKQAFVPKVETDIPCPTCKTGKLQKVWFKNKYFYGCTNYPECSFSAPIEEINFRKEDYREDFNWDQTCPECNAEMKIRHGKYGAFLGCSRYPECKGIVNIPKKGEEASIPEDMLPSCPATGCTGRIVSRRSRFGKIFYSCSAFPDCDVIANSIDQLQEKYVNHPKTPYVKKARGKKKLDSSAKKEKTKDKKKKNKSPPTKSKKEKVMPRFALSEPLSTFLNESSLTRGDVIKKTWDYIKEKGLQDPRDKRKILPDEALSNVVGTKEAVTMFQLPALLGKHLSKEE
jgi:DNA topoisomerase-1